MLVHAVVNKSQIEVETRCGADLKKHTNISKESLLLLKEQSCTFNVICKHYQF